MQKSAQSTLCVLGGVLDLEESLQPPDLENTLADDNAHLENAPPLDARVGAFGGVTVCALADYDIALLVLDLGEELGELLDCTWCENVHGVEAEVQPDGDSRQTYPPSQADLAAPRSRARRLSRER